MRATSYAAGALLGAFIISSTWLAGLQAQPPVPKPTDPPPASYPGFFAKLKDDAEKRKKEGAEKHARLKEFVQKKLAERSGGGRKAPVLDLTHINKELPRTAPAPSPGDPGGLTIEPGERVEVFVKDSQNPYIGAFIGIEGSKVLLQTIPAPDAKPSEVDLRNVQAFQTDDGIFAYNRTTGHFVPALTYYKLNSATGNFERMKGAATDSFLAHTAKVIGGTSSVVALLGVAPDGSWSLGLPVPPAESPASIPASNFQQIVTTDGVYTYDPAAKNFTYETHAAIAQATDAKNLAEMKASNIADWKRRMQEYQIKNPPPVAMNPYYSASWNNQPTWMWWVNRPPTPAPLRK
jgi:hypothetical protein